MNNEKYSLSFTTGTLFHHESVRIAELYAELHQWQQVRDRVVVENLLQARTLNTLKRVCSEVISRLKQLSDEELLLLTATHTQEQGYLLWLALCRRYRFIADFSVEVLRERYISLKVDLGQDNFESFFNRKLDWHPELERITPATKEKLRQVLFKMLREANLLSATNNIQPAMLSKTLINAIANHQREDLLFFPMFEADIGRL